MDRSERHRPICTLAIRHDETREAVRTELARAGWQVIVLPTGADVLATLAGCILGNEPRPVDLVIVEDRLPGCRGRSIAQGLRDLGIDIPVRVIDDEAPPLRLAS